MNLIQDDFAHVRQLIHDQAAIVMGPDQDYLIESRLSALARREGYSSVKALLWQLRAHTPDGLQEKIVEAMTTNETYFFRDLHPFEALKERILPELIKKQAKEKSINVWCAACSSGQEPFSVLMLIREHFPILAGWSLKFIASDISQEMLERASEGKYSQIEVNRGLPALFLVKYFRREGIEFRIMEDLRSAIEFHQINLIRPWPYMPLMDLVMLRNVLIYFDDAAKRSILGRIAGVMRPGGFLILGAAEMGLNVGPGFERVRIGSQIYDRRVAT